MGEAITDSQQTNQIAGPSRLLGSRRRHHRQRPTVALVKNLHHVMDRAESNGLTHQSHRQERTERTRLHEPTLSRTALAVPELPLHAPRVLL